MDIQLRELNFEIIFLGDDFNIELSDDPIILEFEYEEKETIEDNIEKFLLENLETLIKPFIPVLPEVKDGKTPKKGVDYFDGEDGVTPKKGIDYFTKKELSEIRKTIKEAILSEIPKIITEDEINVKFEDILKKIKNLPTGGGGALFLRQLMDINVGNPTAQQYGLTYNPSRSEFSLTTIDSNVAWGQITGTLSNQTDLQAALDDKVPTLRTISTTGLISGGGDLSANRTITTSMSTNKLIGRGTAGTGVMEEITIGAGLALTGNTLDNTATIIGSDTQVLFFDGENNPAGNAGFTYNKINNNLYAGSFAAILPGTITRLGNYISSVALTGGKTITLTRSGNYISSITDGIKTWTYTRNANNQITSWTVA